MIQLLSEAYKTYIDTARMEPERHLSRLVVFTTLSFAFAVFATDKISDVYSMMATGVTVLTGFTFTALFSDHALPSSGLPKPKNENDRLDRVRLGVLSKNFRARSYYFIVISIFETVLLVAACFHFVLPAAMHSWFHEIELVWTISTRERFLVAQKVVLTLPVIVAISINFIYMECLYTFYRMAETVMAILEIKRKYLDADNE